jgi:hypothetical protein
VYTPDAPAVSRVILAATPTLPLKSDVLISDRNRGELNFSAGDLTWRYRNRLTIQRALTIHSFHPIPYGSAEFYYDSKYRKWSSTALYAGVRLPLGTHTEIDSYTSYPSGSRIALRSDSRAREYSI